MTFEITPEADARHRKRVPALSFFLGSVACIQLLASPV